MLKYKHKYYTNKNKLAEDGSFFYDDERLSEELEVCVNTIVKAKRQLKDEGLIHYEAGKYKGRSTNYWISKPPKNEGSNSTQSPPKV